MDWQPISKEELIARIDQGVARMTAAQLRLWRAIEIDPVKWEQNPWGNEGQGFWVVALVGRSVIWYNDIEEGFNRSLYSRLGTIDEYFCNQDELEVAVGFLCNLLEGGHDLVKILAQHHAKRAIP
jgi:hypothetical protein